MDKSLLYGFGGALTSVFLLSALALIGLLVFFHAYPDIRINFDFVGLRSDTPGLLAYISGGFVLVTFTSVALYQELKRSQFVAGDVIKYLIYFNILFILMRFVISPFLLYEPVPSPDFLYADAEVNVLPVIFVLGTTLLYFLFYLGTYKKFRGEVLKSLGEQVKSLMPGSKYIVLSFFVVILFAILFAVLFGRGDQIDIWQSFSTVIFLTLLGQFDFLFYIFAFIPHPIVMFFTVILFLFVIKYMRKAFEASATQSRDAKNAVPFVYFFWVSLILLVGHQMLWFVYFFVMSTLWPLQRYSINAK